MGWRREDDPHQRVGQNFPAAAIIVGDATGDKDGHVGVYGHSVTNKGVYCLSDQDIGIYAKGGSLAGQFDGNVEVNGKLTHTGDFHLTGNVFLTGDVQLVNADCAEDFDVAAAAQVEPGTVMVLDDDGGLRESGNAYDKRVAGVISGAGSYKPGIVLDKQSAQPNRRPLALLGKVFCKVDARYSEIGVGDLLTTSPTPGHAMKATDPQRAFGAVIGKALRPLTSGQGLIPILIALQ